MIIFFEGFDLFLKEDEVAFEGDELDFKIPFGFECLVEGEVEFRDLIEALLIACFFLGQSVLCLHHLLAVFIVFIL